MNYQETLAYMYTHLPMYQRIGAAAYKANLDNTIALCNYLGNPQNQFPTLHVAGTNGKGSSSHLLAAVLQTAGYKVGLYTSPHLKSFTERIRINGKEIGEEAVVNFIASHKTFIEQLSPSFFEMTVGMAFDYFAREMVDIAVIEVGLGGLLDSTNVILPKISLITNISYDHQALLGDTLEEIAAQKAGIIKAHTPVVISEKQQGIDKVFKRVAREKEAPIYFACEEDEYYLAYYEDEEHFDIFKGNELRIENVHCQLKGIYQRKNIPGVLKVIELLKDFPVSDEHISEGLAQVVTLTGLKGRWQTLSHEPLTICDTGHNEGGIREVLRQIARTPHRQLHFVMGMVNDKDPGLVLSQLPRTAIYYFCRPQIPRGLDADTLQKEAQAFHLQGQVYPSVAGAIAAAKAAAAQQDLVFIGGSTFVVAEIEDL